MTLPLSSIDESIKVKLDVYSILASLETSLICILLSGSRDVHFEKRMICFLRGGLGFSAPDFKVNLLNVPKY